MTNYLQSLDIQTTRYDPVEAEFTLTLPLDQPLEGAELRGRLLGPRCPHTETIEIAYPLKPIPGEAGLLRARVVIPEASCWEPSTPFLYEGPVELWQGAQLLERTRVSHGLRHVVLKKQQLLLNGQRCRLHGLARDAMTEEEAPALREAGFNLLLAKATADNFTLWDLADRLGFFILGLVEGAEDDLLWQLDAQHARRTSCLGWVLHQSLARHRQLWHNAMSFLHGQGRKHLIGLRVEEMPLGVIPGHVGFVLCERQHLEDLAEVSIPKLVQLRRAEQALEVKELQLGWVARAL
jgi:hypothetical protein